ncbi:MAG TPA: carboxypeptidase-like regulatory domain-containing protein [Planctomycetaceae bacterium]|nr:carboxypeptidase-like regulatory domain-containing protein [Planctomycetaceae bacterium]
MLLVGCAKGPKLPNTASVSGTVTYQGKPLAGAQVTFNNTAEEGYAAGGLTDANGKYTLKTFFDAKHELSGAVPGDYYVTFTKIEKSTGSAMDQMKAASDAAQQGEASGPKSAIPESYGQPTGAKKAKVEAGKSNTIDFQLE